MGDVKQEAEDRVRCSDTLGFKSGQEGPGGGQGIPHERCRSGKPSPGGYSQDTSTFSHLAGPARSREVNRGGGEPCSQEATLAGRPNALSRSLLVWTRSFHAGLIFSWPARGPACRRAILRCQWAVMGRGARLGERGSQEVGG